MLYKDFYCFIVKQIYFFIARATLGSSCIIKGYHYPPKTVFLRHALRHKPIKKSDRG